MKKLINDKKFLIEIIVYLFLLYLISSCIFLNGDDFMYGTFAQGNIFSSVLSYYFTGNGRFWINILDSFVLSFDRYLFIAINPIIILIFIIFLAKNIQWFIEKKANYENEIKYIRWGMILFVCLDVMCLRETTFWITGMMNYLFPAIIFLIGIYLFQIVNSGIDINKYLYFIICILASSSVEQYALMFVGFVTLSILLDVFKKRKINIRVIGGYVLSLTALTFLILAPGNFVRVDNQIEQMPTFIENAWSLVYQDTMSFVAFPLFFTLLMISAIIFNQNKDSVFRKVYTYMTLIFVLLVEYLPVIHNAICISISILLSIFIFISVFLIDNYEFKEISYILIIIGLGSQIMLLISVIWGYRCMFSLYVIYMMLIMLLLTKVKDINFSNILTIGVLLNINIIAVPLYLIFDRFFRNNYVKSIVRSGVVAAYLLILYTGYNSNVSIYQENIIATKASETVGSINLKELINDKYSWYSIPMNEFHEKYYKLYYHVDDKLKFNYIETR